MMRFPIEVFEYKKGLSIRTCDHLKLAEKEGCDVAIFYSDSLGRFLGVPYLGEGPTRRIWNFLSNWYNSIVETNRLYVLRSISELEILCVDCVVEHVKELNMHVYSKRAQEIRKYYVINPIRERFSWVEIWDGEKWDIFRMDIACVIKALIKSIEEIERIPETLPNAQISEDLVKEISKGLKAYLEEDKSCSKLIGEPIAESPYTWYCTMNEYGNIVILKIEFFRRHLLVDNSHIEDPVIQYFFKKLEAVKNDA